MVYIMGLFHLQAVGDRVTSPRLPGSSPPEEQGMGAVALPPLLLPCTSRRSLTFAEKYLSHCVKETDTQTCCGERAVAGKVAPAPVRKVLGQLSLRIP